MHKNVKLKTSQVLEREGLGEYKYIERPGQKRSSSSACEPQTESTTKRWPFYTAGYCIMMTKNQDIFHGLQGRECSRTCIFHNGDKNIGLEKLKRCENKLNTERSRICILHNDYKNIGLEKIEVVEMNSMYKFRMFQSMHIAQ